MTTVLVIGDYRQSLTVARSLHRRGDRVVAAIAPRGRSHLRRSRAVSDRWEPGMSVDEPGFAQAFETALRRYCPDVIFPIGDREITWCAQDLAASGMPVASVDIETARVCQDKALLLEIASDLGVMHARSGVARDLVDVRKIANEVGYPVVVKSNHSTRRLLGRKAIVCHSQSDLDASLQVWPTGHDSLVVERYVEGPRHNVYFASSRGELKGLVEVKILRTDTPDGTGYAVEGVTVSARPELIAATEALSVDLKYHGVGCTQFIVSPAGDTSFLELKTRLGANNVVADRAGLDLAGIAVDLALGRLIPTQPIPKVGVRYVWFTGDLLGLKNEVRRGGVGLGGAIRWLARALWSGLTTRVHVTWRLRDPVPTLSVLWSEVGVPVLQLVFRRVR